MACSTPVGATGLDSSKEGSPPHGFFGPPWNFLGGLCRQSQSQSQFIFFKKINDYT